MQTMRLRMWQVAVKFTTDIVVPTICRQRQHVWAAGRQISFRMQRRLKIQK